MSIYAFDHYTVRSADLDASSRFYERGLGLNVRRREGFPVPAFIVSIGEQEVVHVFQASPEMEAIFARLAPVDEEAARWRTGRLQHVEFWAIGLEETRERLAKEGIATRERTLPDKHQLQMSDPDGVEVNLNFPLAEVAAGR